ncbi:hypothetical protein SME24J_09610 [Serratia marcescens]|nr:hypothetical protein SME24J_09610 [Serratia marcescens]
MNFNRKICCSCIVSLFCRLWRNFVRHFAIFILFFFASIFVFGVLFYYWTHFNDLPVSNSVEKWGQFGDYVGGVLNPGLSFLSIVLVCLTLYSTSRNSAVQSFESILFELLKFHKENLSEIKVSYADGVQVLGRDALEWYATEVKFKFLNEVSDEHEVVDRIKISVDSVYMDGDTFSNVGHYFRNIYHIFKHIDEASFLNGKEKVKYAKLVRAQISSIESGALFLNGLSSQGNASKTLIEKYSLLQGFGLNEGFKNKLEELGVLNLYAAHAYEDKKGH